MALILVFLAQLNDIEHIGMHEIDSEQTLLDTGIEGCHVEYLIVFLHFVMVSLKKLLQAVVLTLLFLIGQHKFDLIDFKGFKIKNVDFEIAINHYKL